MTSVEVVPFVREGLGNSSYLVRVGEGQAIVVDPDRSAARYLGAAEARGWRIVGVFDTHLHADFVTGGLEVAAASDARIFVPSEADVGYPSRGLAPGDRIEIGDVEIEAVASPGHTPEHLSYVVRGDEPAAPVLFSGGALIVGGAARTDLISPDMTERLTRAQFRTIRGAFSDLPDETVLYPTHGGGSFCSVGSGGGERTSTLGHERATNPLFEHVEEDAFVRWFPTTFPGAPDYFFRLRDVNRAGPRLAREIPAPPPLSPEAFDHEREAGAMVIDLRPSEAYAAGHVPGSLSIPFRQAYATWLGWIVPENAPLLFVADGVPLREVIEESLLVGYERFAGVLDGGVDAWAATGRSIGKAGLSDAEEVARALDEGAIAIDVRERSEVSTGKIPGALELPLGELEERVHEVPRDRPLVVYCAAGSRSATAISILERAGRGPLVNLRGGYDSWKRRAVR